MLEDFFIWTIIIIFALFSILGFVTDLKLHLNKVDSNDKTQIKQIRRNHFIKVIVVIFIPFLLILIVLGSTGHIKDIDSWKFFLLPWTMIALVLGKLDWERYLAQHYINKRNANKNN